MKKTIRLFTTVMVCTAMALCVSCKKDDDDDNPGGGNGNTGGGGGGTDITGTIAGHGYVDLGLPSGLLWATCNVGASKPEDYGDYYAWGETSPKESYDLCNYKWFKGWTNHNDPLFLKYIKAIIGDSGEIPGYNDYKTVLEPADDVANVNWGGGWRMPTKDDFNELCTNCTIELTVLNGMNGYKATGPNGKSIFLPAAGRFVYNFELYGKCALYWSSSLYLDSNSEYAYIFYGSNGGGTVGCCDERDRGNTVRPVSAPQK